MFEAIGLCKRRPSRRPGDPPVLALDSFELRIAAGEVCGLIGHNGAGKTTFARIVAGLERPDAGHVVVAGVDALRHPRAACARLGYAPQEPALYPSATVRENLRLFGGLAGQRGAPLRAGMAEVMAALAVEELADRRVDRLSGGQQRRVQTASALLHRPAVLLLDEPTVGADPVTRQALLTAVRRLADRGTAVCYTTHYLPELDELDATVAVAARGRVIARGARARVLAGLPGRVVVGFAGEVPTRLYAGRRDRAVEPGEAAGTADLHVVTPRPDEYLPRLFAEIGDALAGVRAVAIRRPTLDDLYRHVATTPEVPHAA